MPTILVVDDSATDRTRAAGLLRRAGFEVTTATDGQAALDQMSVRAPDAVVTDLQMPRRDGFALLETMANDFPLVPVVAVTSQGSEMAAVRALQAGAASYVPKRNLAAELPETVRRVCLVAGEDRGLARLENCLVRQEVHYRIATDLELISPLVRTVRNLVNQVFWMDDRTALRTALAFEEALLNAVYHGNLEMDPSLREEGEDYYEAARQRATTPPYQDRVVLAEIALSRFEVRFRLRDEGRGFDPDTVADPTTPENLSQTSGRGLLLIRAFMDEVTHDSNGQQITMIKRLRSPGFPA